jgi:hypothetical protein
MPSLIKDNSLNIDRKENAQKGRSGALVLMFMACLALFGWTAPALAFSDQIVTDNAKMLNDYASEIPYDSFLENSTVFQEMPKGDKFLEYKIRLLKGWKQNRTSRDFEAREDDDRQLSLRLSGRIAEYFGPARVDGTMRLEVHAQEMEFEMSALNWLSQDILGRGYTLQGIEAKSNNEAEAEYVAFIEDVPYVIRSRAMINGTRMVVVSMYVPDFYWQKVRALQQYIIESFEFVSPEEVKISHTKTFKFLDVLEMDYPSSWELVEPNIYSIDNMEVKLVRSKFDKKTTYFDDLRYILEGEINVNIVSYDIFSTMSEELALVQEPLVNFELSVGDLLEPISGLEVGEKILHTHAEIYRLEHKNKRIQDHEYWLAVMRAPDYFYFIAMVTPSRNYEYAEWARNAEGFRTVVESIGPLEDSMFFE